MPANIQIPQTQHNPAQAIDQCVRLARTRGLDEYQLDRRCDPRLPFAHPVRYCLDSIPSEAQTHPGYALNISRKGMAFHCQQAIALGSRLCVRLPLPDGTTCWFLGQVAHCEPDEHHYRVGITFTLPDDADLIEPAPS